jgi:hypothetical protein
VIAALVAAYADAIAYQVGPTVPVYRYRPETAAGPAVWVELESVTWRKRVLHVALRAVVLPADGRVPETAAADIYGLTDHVLAAGIGAGAPAEGGLVARPSSRLVGDVSWPVVEVVATTVANSCDLPPPVVAALASEVTE